MFYSFGHTEPLKIGYNLSHIDFSYLHLIARKELRRVANHALSHVVFEEEVERFECAACSRIGVDGPHAAHQRIFAGGNIILVRTLPIARFFTEFADQHHVDIKALKALNRSRISLLLTQPVRGYDADHVGIFFHGLNHFEVAALCEDVAFEFFPTVETILHVAYCARAGSVENQRKFAAAVRHLELFPIGDAPLYDAAQLFEVDYSVSLY